MERRPLVLGTAGVTELPVGDTISAIDASDVLSKLITVDGASSGLDADLLDGNHAAAFATSGHNHSGTYEPTLGNPASNGQLLASTTGGTRSWVTSDSSGLILLATASASNSTSVDFTSGIDSTYDEYQLHIINALPGTNGAQALFRTSSNGGSSYDAGASNYSSPGYANESAVFLGYYGDTNISNNSLYNGLSGVVSIFNPSSSSYKHMSFSVVYYYSSTFYYGANSGLRFSTSTVNAIRFLFSAGNIVSGLFKLYGLRKTV